MSKETSMGSGLGERYEFVSRQSQHTFHTDQYNLRPMIGGKGIQVQRSVPKREGKTIRDRRRVERKGGGNGKD